MTPPDLAGIVERDRVWTPPSIGEDEHAEEDRRALFGLLRETREALAALDHAFGTMYVGGQWRATPERIRVWIPAQELLARLAALGPLP